MLLSSLISRLDVRSHCIAVRCLTVSALHVSGTVSEQCQVQRYHYQSSLWMTLPGASRSKINPVITGCSHSLSAAEGSNKSLKCKPRIILIGWLGAQERHFNKYISLWEDWGHDTQWIRPPTAAIAIPPLGSWAAARFAQQLHDANSAGHPDQQTVIHLFSNAGFIFFGTLLRELAASSQDNVAEHSQGARGNAFDPSAAAAAATLQPSLSSVLGSIQGIIIDSAPSRITPDIAARGLVSAFLGVPADIVEGKHPRAVAAARSLARPYLRLPIIADRQRDVWDAWQSAAPLCPQLYLHSAVDMLVPQPEVAAFQEIQAARGVTVHSILWEDSPHCEHFRYHHEEYRDALQSFLAS